MVLTKMPMLPLGESLPPTTLNPSPFFPWPFSKVTVWTVHGCCNELSEPTGVSLDDLKGTEGSIFLRNSWIQSNPTKSIS
jgi:hypothetical protein